MAAVSTSAGIEEAAMAIVEKIRKGEMTLDEVLGPLTISKDHTGAIPKINIPPGGTKIPTVANACDAEPKDEHNVKLVDNVHPADHVNPPEGSYDLVAIGAGVAGLLTVIIGKALGKRCAMIERHYMGGDCLNVGCFPSKAIIACARRAHEVRTAKDYGVNVEGVTVDFPFVMERMRKLRAHIAPNDSVDRYKRDFCEEIFLGQAEFTGSNTIKVTGAHGDSTVTFDKCVIATGASPMIPPIPGLKETPHLTNHNIFNMTELPSTMVVIGAGPIGMELSQAFQRFGSKVTVLELGKKFLPKEDPDASDIVRKAMERDGVTLHLDVKFKKVECSEEGNTMKAPFKKYSVTVEINGKETVFHADAVLNGTGRAPNVHGLGLEVAGVEYDSRKGVLVNEFYRTTNKNIYATGDVASVFKFTHAADWMTRIAIRNMFLGDEYTEQQLVIPWCTYVDPEVAHVGKYEADLVAENIEFETYKYGLEHDDRAICEGTTDGFVKMHVRKGSDEILGATIVGTHAGDMISEISTCIQYNIGAAKLAGVMRPYPTKQEAVRRAAAQYNKHFKTDVNKKVIDIISSGDSEPKAKKART
eukprot:m.337040 g.337040  ORF g.337040 m.337040 type:complete len:587 (+) comp18028_c0_seq1:82-1842(+)